MVDHRAGASILLVKQLARRSLGIEVAGRHVDL